MTKTAQYLRDLRRKRKEKGICYECREPAMPGYVLCKKHHAANRARDREKKAMRRLSGICVDCKEPAMPGHLRCEKHNKEANGRTRKQAKRYQEQGRCPKCGGNKLRLDTVTCQHCIDTRQILKDNTL